MNKPRIFGDGEAKDLCAHLFQDSNLVTVAIVRGPGGGFSAAVVLNGAPDYATARRALDEITRLVEGGALAGIANIEDGNPQPPKSTLH